MIDVKLEQLLEAGAHFGHQARRWNPKMEKYLFGVRDGIHVFDLVKTREQLMQALDVLQKASAENKFILFVGTKKQAKEKLTEMAQNVGCMYVNRRWMGGTLTNFNQIQKSLRAMADLRKKLEGGEFADYTKKERLLIERKIQDLEKSFGGIADMDRLPDLMVIVDIHHEKAAVAEAKKTGVPVIGVVDSNSDPNQVDYPIPMNDDATSALDFVINLFGEAVLEGKKGTAKPKTKAKVKKASKK